MKSKRGMIIAAMVTVALLAIPVTGASASTRVEAGGELHGSGTIYVTAAGALTECSAEFSASGGGSTVTTTSVSLAWCSGSWPFSMNGCQFELNPAGRGWLSIAPTGCGPARKSVSTCPESAKVPAQKIPATYEDLGSGSEAYFNIHAKTESGEYTSCGVTHHDLSFIADLKVTSTGGATAITGGLYANEATGKFEAAEYPAGISGEPFYLQSGKSPHLLSVSSLEEEFTCKGNSYSGGYSGGQMTQASSVLLLNATYTECYDSNEVPFTVVMNNCRYAFTNLTAGSYATSKVSCVEGEAITLRVWNGACKIKIPNQTLNGLSGLSNYESAQDHEAVLIGQWAGSNVSYSTEGWACPLLYGAEEHGTYTDGVTDSGVKLKGVFG